jgi:iron(III) transport system ATP-binding protein
VSASSSETLGKVAPAQESTNHQGTSTDDKYAVRVANIAKRFGRHEALKGVSFDVPRGTFCTLLGPSGCGKTTMLRLLAGLDRPDSGEIVINSRVVTSDRLFIPPESRRVGFVFQSYALWPHMTVYDHVAYPLRAQRFQRSGIRRAVMRTIDTVGLTNEVMRYPSELSGGQQQRVALARALVNEPTILLLDEPLSNLDARLREQMRLELHELHRRVGVTAIYVTHDQTEAMALSDMVIVMQSGRIIETGAPRAIYDRPRTTYAAAFVGSANLLSGVVIKAGHTPSVRLADGTIIDGTSGSEAISQGESVVVAIKPEDLALFEAGETTQHVSGEVQTVTYLGAHVVLRVATLGQEIRVQLDKASLIASGETIALALRPDHVHVLPVSDLPTADVGSPAGTP